MRRVVMLSMVCGGFPLGCTDRLLGAESGFAGDGSGGPPSDASGGASDPVTDSVSLSETGAQDESSGDSPGDPSLDGGEPGDASDGMPGERLDVGASDGGECPPPPPDGLANGLPACVVIGDDVLGCYAPEAGVECDELDSQFVVSLLGACAIGPACGTCGPTAGSFGVCCYWGTTADGCGG